MKPTNWRKFYGYRPSRALTYKPYQLQSGGRGTIESKYIAWLMADRGWNHHEAEQHINAMPRGGLISSVHGREPFDQSAPLKAKRDPIALFCAKIRKHLAWSDIEAIQNAIDQRLAA